MVQLREFQNLLILSRISLPNFEILPSRILSTHIVISKAKAGIFEAHLRDFLLYHIFHGWLNDHYKGFSFHQMDVYSLVNDASVVEYGRHVASMPILSKLSYLKVGIGSGIWRKLVCDIPGILLCFFIAVGNRLQIAVGIRQ